MDEYIAFGIIIGLIVGLAVGISIAQYFESPGPK